MRLIARLSILPLLALVSYVVLLTYPMPLFAYHRNYEQFDVYSDRTIPVEIEAVLQSVLNNIEQSEFYSSTQKFKLFFCSDKWRFHLLSRNPNAGGNVSGVISPNVFVRESDIKANRIVPPNGWMYDTENRPLSYFLSHELTHAMQARFDRFMILKVPRYVMEGYADYIGKSDRFDYQEYRSMLIDDHPYMQEGSPLYNRYHLYIAHLIDVRGLSIKEIIKSPPKTQMILEDIFRGDSS